MKRGLALSLILGIFLVGFVSAFGHYRYSNYFDSSLIIYGGLFILFFALLNFILGRTIFRENKPTRTVMSLVLAMFVTYGLTTSNIATGIGGVSIGRLDLGSFLPTLITLIFIGGIIYFIYKWGFGWLFVTLGTIFILLSWTELVYEKNTFMVMGIILLILGIILLLKKKKTIEDDGHDYDGGGDPEIREKIIYKHRRRSMSDLKQKHKQYKFEYNKNIKKLKNETSEQYRKRKESRKKWIRKAMKIIEKKMRRL